MGCCGKKKKVNNFNNKGPKPSRFTPAVKSNRIPAGKMVKQCATCRTRSISEICPICGSPMEDPLKIVNNS